MEAYTGFAEVYDLFMDNIPYEEWAQYVVELLKKNGVSSELENNSVVDLGCGTGTFTEILSRVGFEMIGIDNSQDMLMIANAKKYEDSDNTIDTTLYTLQDMRDFEVLDPVAAVVSVCDSMNYIIEEEELAQVFKCVKRSLDKNGVFIFDMKTEHFYRDVLGENIIAENRDEASFIWDNYYYEDESINEYGLAIFVKEQNGLYRKYEETHVQRSYTIEQVKKALDLSKLEIVDIYDAFTENPPNEDSERLYFVVK